MKSSECSIQNVEAVIEIKFLLFIHFEKNIQLPVSRFFQNEINT